MSHEKLIGMDQLDGWLLKPKVTPSLIFILKGDRIMNGSAVLKKVGMTVEKNLPTILSFVASAGVVGTAVLVGKETLKASQLLDQAKNEDEELTKMEILKVVVPVYIPAIIVGVSTVACIMGSNSINQKRQASLAGALTMLEAMHNEYREKVKEQLGSEAEKQIRDAIAKEKLDSDKDIPEGMLRFFDEYSGRFFERTMSEVTDAEYHFNRNYALRGYAELNEFYEFLGLEPTDLGMTIGWSEGAGAAFYGYSWIDFEHRLVKDLDGSSYYAIEMPFSPTADFMDY